MLSKVSARLLTFSVKWTSTLGGIPLSWDERRSKLRICPNSWKKWIFWLVYLAITSAFHIITLGLSLTVYSDDTNIYQKTRRFLPMLGCVIPAILGFHTWMYHLEFACFVNSYIKFVQHFRNSYVRRLGRGWRNGCEGLLQFILVWSFVFPILFTVLYFQNPSDPHYMTSLLPSNTHGSIYWTICILFGTLQFFWVAAATSAVTFYAMIMILIQYIVFQLFREIMPGHHRYITKPTVRRPPRLCQIYRSIQILNMLCNNAIEKCMLPLKISSQLFSVVGNCVLIVFWKNQTNVSRILLGTLPNLYLASWLQTIYLSGKLWKTTQVCIHTWKILHLKTYADIIFMKKFRTSCLPIRIRVGSFYFLKPIRVLLTVHSTLRTTFKVSIGIKKCINN